MAAAVPLVYKRSIKGGTFCWQKPSPTHFLLFAISYSGAKKSTIIDTIL